MIPRTFSEYSWAGGGTAMWAVCRAGTAVSSIVRWFVVQKPFTKGRKDADCSGMTPVPTTSYCSAVRLPTPTPLSFEKVTEFISASKDQTINTSALDKVNASLPCCVPQHPKVWLEVVLMAISASQLQGRSVDLVKALKRRSKELLNVGGRDGLCVPLFLLDLQLRFLIAFLCSLDHHCYLELYLFLLYVEVSPQEHFKNPFFLSSHEPPFPGPVRATKVSLPQSSHSRY